MTGLRILIVEDDAVTAESLADVLRLSGARAADWAADGEAAMVRLGAATYDALVLDYYLPALDGLATLRRLRAAGVRTPAVLVTAAASGEAAALAAQATALPPACVLRKPFAPRELGAAVRGLMTEAESDGQV